MNRNEKIKASFTLAEILIVLTLIGVIASLTITSVVKNAKERETVVKVNRMYSDLNRAYDVAVVQNGPITGWVNTNNWDMGYRQTVIFDRLIAPNFPVDRNCGIRGEGCMVRSETDCKTLDGTVLSGNNIHFHPCQTGNNWNQTWHWVGSYNRSTTRNGYGIAIQSPRSTWNNAEWGRLSDGTKIVSIIVIDINGTKAPNTLGRDMFVYGVSTKGIITFGPDVVSGDFRNYPNTCNPNVKSSVNGAGCSHWILVNKNMRYLRR